MILALALIALFTGHGVIAFCLFIGLIFDLKPRRF
jgi:hypothetical protein